MIGQFRKINKQKSKVRTNIINNALINYTNIQNIYLTRNIIRIKSHLLIYINGIHNLEYIIKNKGYYLTSLCLVTGKSLPKFALLSNW